VAPGRILAGLLVVAAAVTCVRLGFWQLERAAARRAVHRALVERLARPPVELADSLPPAPPEPGRRAHVVGRWDEARHVLLSGRTHLGAAGVLVVTPVLLASGERVLVERGWMPSADARTAHPELDVPGTADLTGVVEALPRSPRVFPWVALPSERGDVTLWSARTLDSAEVTAHVPPPWAPWYVRALAPPAGAATEGPLPVAAVPSDSGARMHVAYALQWFAFAVLAVAVPWALARREARRAGRTP